MIKMTDKQARSMILVCYAFADNENEELGVRTGASVVIDETPESFISAMESSEGYSDVQVLLWLTVYDIFQEMLRRQKIVNMLDGLNIDLDPTQ